MSRIEYGGFAEAGRSFLVLTRLADWLQVRRPETSLFYLEAKQASEALHATQAPVCVHNYTRNTEYLPATGVDDILFRRSELESGCPCLCWLLSRDGMDASGYRHSLGLARTEWRGDYTNLLMSIYFSLSLSLSRRIPLLAGVFSRLTSYRKGYPSLPDREIETGESHTLCLESKRNGIKSGVIEHSPLAILCS